MKNSVNEYVREENGRRILRMSASGEKGQKMNYDGRYMNLLNRYNTKNDSSTAYEYQSEGPVADMELTEQYIENGLFATIIDAPAEEAVKHGYDFKLNDPEVEAFISDELDRLDWEETAATAIKWSRLYGGAIIVMLVDDGCGLDEPLDWDSVEEVEELRVYERAIVEPDQSSLYSYNPEKVRKRGSRFQNPEFYYVNSQYGQFRVHESRCLIFRNGRLPETGYYSAYQYFGIPEHLRIQHALRETILSHSFSVRMLERCVQAVYKMKNLSNLLNTDDGEMKVLKRLEVIDLARSILSSLVIDSDGEEYDFRSMPLSGVKDILDSTCNMLSAATHIPQTILFGRSPAGENSTGESDMENYYNYVGKIQKMMLKKNLRVLLDLVFECGRKKGGIKEIPDYKVGFIPLWSLSEAEQANVDSVKAATEQTKAATAQVYVDMQALDPTEVREGLKKSEEFTINDLLNEEDDLDIAGLLGIDLPGGEEETVTEEAQNSGINALPIQNTTDTETKASGTRNASIWARKDTSDVKKEGVGVLVVKDGKILVGDRRDGKGICGPGGHIEPGEGIQEAAAREALEEFNIIPAELLPLGMTEAVPPELSSHIFLCTEFYQLPFVANPEIENGRFASLDELSHESHEGERLFTPFGESLGLLLSALGIRTDKGNSNSGNHNHKGRPGQLGGSGGGGSGLGNPLSAGQRKAYEEKIVGQKTSKGVTIKKLSKHSCDRMGQRRITINKVMEVLQHPEMVTRDNNHGGGNKFRYKKGRVILLVDHDEGEIITAFKH